MTQDCSLTPSIADENGSYGDLCFPKGIQVAGTGEEPDSGIEVVSRRIGGNEGNVKGNEDKGKPWGYILIHNKKIESFKKQVDAYNLACTGERHECFIHYSYKYKQKSNGRGVIKKQMPTISGLVFLQGTTIDLQQFLRKNYPQYHLINNCSTGKPACIDNGIMQPFMEAVRSHPENVTFLRDPFVKFAKDHTKLRVLTGLFKGLEGYIVRVDRDRQLVMEFGGYAVAIRGIHNEDFEAVE